MRRLTFRNYIGLFFLSAVVLSMLGCSIIQPRCKTTPPIDSRPSTWALQMKGNCNVPNLYMIDDNVYRSGRPTEAGIKLLCEQLNIHTVINLEAFNSDPIIECSHEFHNVQIPFNPLPPFETKEMIEEVVIKVMKTLSHKKNGPFLIHCLHGSDRTGLMSAMYHILFSEGWTKEKAIDEMVNGGYGFNTQGYHHFIDYIQKADIEELRKQIQAQ